MISKVSCDFNHSKLIIWLYINGHGYVHFLICKKYAWCESELIHFIAMHKFFLTSSLKMYPFMEAAWNSFQSEVIFENILWK